MKDFEEVVDEKKAEEDAEKILTGNFDLHDFVEQIKLVRKMGSLNDLLEKFPLFGELPEGVNFDDKELRQSRPSISSMTQAERQEPAPSSATSASSASPRARDRRRSTSAGCSSASSGCRR